MKQLHLTTLLYCLGALPFAGCGEGAQATEDIGDGAEKGAEQTENAANKAGEAIGDSAEAVGEVAEDGANAVADGVEDAIEAVGDGVEGAVDEGDEAINDVDASLDCASFCDSYRACSDYEGDEDSCYDACDDLAIKGESNDAVQEQLDACEVCVDDSEDKGICDDDQFLCARPCEGVIEAVEDALRE